MSKAPSIDLYRIDSAVGAGRDAHPNDWQSAYQLWNSTKQDNYFPEIIVNPVASSRALIRDSVQWDGSCRSAMRPRYWASSQINAVPSGIEQTLRFRHSWRYHGGIRDHDGGRISQGFCPPEWPESLIHYRQYPIRLIAATEIGWYSGWDW